MDIKRIVSELDAEISRLQKIRSALIGIEDKNPSSATSKRGPAAGSKKLTKKAASIVAAKPSAKKRKLSPEGRKRIAEAMKRRWAAHRKATQGK